MPRTRNGGRATGTPRVRQMVKGVSLEGAQSVGEPLVKVAASGLLALVASGSVGFDDWADSRRVREIGIAGVECGSGRRAQFG